MPEAFLRHLRMNPCKQQLRGVSMTEIVEPDLGHILRATDCLLELVCQASRRHRLTIRPRAEQRLPRLAHPEPQKDLGLLALQPPQFGYCKRGQRDRARLFVEIPLGTLEV